ncbi:MAG TPA: ribonuclease HII [Chlamydiales bacterium]|nr:ribonuclease HII [Chlamydiales bacterium]
MAVLEKRLLGDGFVRIAGIDEAGRGSLAGPVVAAACILPQNTYFEHLNDSKQLTPAIREILYEKITSHPGICFAIGMSDAETIDRVNILQATFLAMKAAIEKLDPSPDFLLVDGSQVPAYDKIPMRAVIKGDSTSISIAAASIIAKVTRDWMMIKEYDLKWPQYGFKKHKGYPTPQHFEAIDKSGPCPLHRISFHPFSAL